MAKNSIELQIILGLNCNFACKHCLNSSKPNYHAFDISENEIEMLAATINSDTRIDGVAFNGGEPLLYIKQMLSLKNKIHRNIHWSMTSNGSKVYELLEQLQQLKLDSAILSFDKYHEKFQSISEFEKSMIQAKTVIPKLEINFVYEKLEDFAPVAEMCERLDITVAATQLIGGGRSKGFKEAPELFEQESQCPNFKPSRTKITFLAQRGFTLCCGPLVFDHNMDKPEFFSQNLDEVFESLEYKSFSPGFGENQIFSLVSSEIGKGGCGGCANVFNRLLSADLGESTINLLNRKFLETKEYLNPILEKSLSRAFHVKYLIRLEPQNHIANDLIENVNGMQIEHVTKPTEKDLTDFRDFAIRSFYTPYSHEYNEKDVQEFISGMSTYFSGDGETNTFFFRKNDLVVAVLTLYRYKNHPFFKDEAFHIGYWGYHRESIDSADARFIKFKWNEVLKELASSNGIPVVGLIDYFNGSVRKMVSGFGFNLTALRLDKRP